MSYPEKRRSNAWYLLPIFLGLIGGVIAFLILFRSDFRKAIYCVLIGVLSWILGLVVGYWVVENTELSEDSNVNV